MWRTKLFVAIDFFRILFISFQIFIYKYKYKYNSYFYCAPYSLTDGALQKSADTCFTVVNMPISVLKFFVS